MIEPSKKSIVIVDAYSTAALLPGILAKAGYNVLHVQSSPEIPAIYQKSFNPRNFSANFINYSLNDLAAALKQYAITKVIAGAESGTIIADIIGSLLKLPSNNPQTSNLRRNKYLMGEAIRKAGLTYVKQELINDDAKAVYTATQWNNWPVVIKPLDSAGGDGVTICRNAQAITQAVTQLLHKQNRLNIKNNHILLQERMFGQQYIVNTMSFDGMHFVTELWKDNRMEIPGAGLVYDNEVLLDTRAPEWPLLKEYALGVLNALGVSYGPCHIEIMLTSEGPKLIELGARMQGSISSKAIVEAIGESHLTLTGDLLIDPISLKKKLKDPYQVKKHAMVVQLIINDSGRIEVSYLEDKIAPLESFREFSFKSEVGDTLSPTIDLFTCPGMVYLVNENKAQLINDYHAIRKLEAESSLFKLV